MVRNDVGNKVANYVFKPRLEQRFKHVGTMVAKVHRENLLTPFSGFREWLF